MAIYYIIINMGYIHIYAFTLSHLFTTGQCKNTHRTTSMVGTVELVSDTFRDNASIVN